MIGTIKMCSAVIQQIKDQINLIDYIGQFVELKPVGKNYQGLCPFHDDKKSPSLLVQPDHWYCFGCGAGGDIIEFAMRWSHRGFKDVVNEFAKQIGVRADYEPINLDPWLKGIREAGKYELLQPNFLSEKIVEEYSKHRHAVLREEGWLESTIQEFQIGFCVDIYDELFNRITIPIRDAEGHLVGIAGRRTNEDQEKKYRFAFGVKKEQLLYGLDKSLPYIRESKQMVVVEGYKDLWRCWEAGVKNVVAIMGAIASPVQIRLIKRYCRDIIIALDDDFDKKKNSGQDGAMKLANELKLLCRVRLVKYPEGKKDFGECNYDEIRHAIKTAKEIR